MAFSPFSVRPAVGITPIRLPAPAGAFPFPPAAPVGAGLNRPFIPNGAINVPFNPTVIANAPKGGPCINCHKIQPCSCEKVATSVTFQLGATMKSLSLLISHLSL